MSSRSSNCERLLLQLTLNRTRSRASIPSTFDASVLQITYGVKASETDDKYHAMMERAMEVGEGVLTPGRYAVEALPFLRYLPSWLPGGRFKQYAAQVKTEVREIMNTLFEASRDQMVRTIHLYAVVTS